MIRRSVRPRAFGRKQQLIFRMRTELYTFSKKKIGTRKINQMEWVTMINNALLH